MVAVKKSTIVCLGILCALLWTSMGFAQLASSADQESQQQPPKSFAQSDAGQNGPQAPGPKPNNTTSPEQEKEIEKEEQSQRMLWLVPEFGVTSRHYAPALTAGGKFHLFAKSTFDPVEFATVGVQAGMSQAEDEFPAYGQGAAGYSKRYGAALADQVSSGFFANFFYPVLFKEDPRYFRLGEGSIKHRFAYSLVQEVICHTDKGGRAFNWSNALGALTAGSISNAYYPQSDRGFGLTMNRAGVSLLYGSLGGLVDEFYPDIAKRLFHKNKKTNGGDTK